MMMQVVQAVTAAMAMMVVVMSIIIYCYSAIVGLNAIYVISNIIGGCGCQQLGTGIDYSCSVGGGCLLKPTGETALQRVDKILIER